MENEANGWYLCDFIGSREVIEGAGSSCLAGRRSLTKAALAYPGIQPAEPAASVIK